MPVLSIQLLNPPGLPTPVGYSQVAVASGGDLIVIAGQVALDERGNVVGPGDFAAQTTQVFHNLIGALEAVGAGPRNLIKLTTFVTDVSQLAIFRQIRDQLIPSDHQPASTLVQVSRLFRPEFLIEIEAWALR